MKHISIKGKTFVKYLSRDEIGEIVSTLAKKIDLDYSGQSVVLLSVLNGSFIFTSDLMRAIKTPSKVVFTKIRSYEGMCSSGKITEELPLSPCLKGSHVIIVEDIIDTGMSMQYIKDRLEMIGVASQKICTLLFKPESFQCSYHIDYIGKSISNEFVVGYGLDYDGDGRQFEDIYQVYEE